MGRRGPFPPTPVCCSLLVKEKRTHAGKRAEQPPFPPPSTVFIIQSIVRGSNIQRGRLLDNLVFGTATGRNIKNPVKTVNSKGGVSHGTNGMFSSGVTLERQEGTCSRINRTAMKEESSAAGAAR